MEAREILSLLADMEVTVWVGSDGFHVSPAGMIDQRLRGQMQDRRTEITTLLRSKDDPVALWHRLSRGMEMLWELEKAGQVSTEKYNALFLGWFGMLEAYKKALRELAEKVFQTPLITEKAGTEARASYGSDV